MAEKALQLEVVTPERVVFKEKVDFVVAPGTEGSLGFLPGHVPLITSLEIGVVKYTKNGQQRKIAISGGFLEIKNDKIVILANTAERDDEIDVERAKAAKARAEQRLASRTPDIDLVRAELALKRALARLQAAGHQ